MTALSTLLSVAIFLLISTSSSATTYYVDDAGSDAADGLTIGTAWLTFNKAWQTIACGDTVKVLPGIYYRARMLSKSRTCTAGTRITFQANDPLDRPILAGGSSITGWTQVAGKNIWWYQLTDATERKPFWLYQIKAGVVRRLKHASYPDVVNEDQPYQDTSLLNITIAAPGNDTLTFPADLDTLDCDDCGFQALGSADDEMLLRENAATYNCSTVGYDPSSEVVTFVSSCQPVKGDIGEQTSYRSCRFLDADGEWCSETVGGVTKVYVRPFAGDDPSAVSIILPHFRDFGNFATSNHSADFVTFDGFIFRFYGDYAADTVPPSETCGVCLRLFNGGYMHGFKLLNIDNTYGSSNTFNGGGADAGLESDPLFQNITCNKIVASCIGFGRSHPTNSVVTFQNITATDVVGDPISFGTGGVGTAGELWATGQIIIDNLIILGCDNHWAGHNDCVQTHKVKALTIKNSTIYRTAVAKPIPTYANLQTFWVTGQRDFVIQDSTMRDGIIGANNSAYLTVVNNTFQNMRFRQVAFTSGMPPDSYPTVSALAGNTIIGSFSTEFHQCDSAVTSVGCDPTQDMLSPNSPFLYTSRWGCNDFSQANLTTNWPYARDTDIHYNYNKALLGPMAGLPGTQKYETGWITNTGYPNASYGLQGHTSVVPATAQVDTDADTIWSCFDNCLNVSNASQLDTDGDGYGQPCDADFDNNGVVGASDFNHLRDCFTLPGTGSCADADMDANGVVGASDFNNLRIYFGLPPGPSCCGTSGGESAFAPGGGEPTGPSQSVPIP